VSWGHAYRRSAPNSQEKQGSPAHSGGLSKRCSLRQVVDLSIDKWEDHLPLLSGPRDCMAPLDARFIEALSRLAVPSVVRFRCDMLSLSSVKVEGRDKSRRELSD